MPDLVLFRLQGEDRESWSTTFASALEADPATSHAVVGRAAERQGLAALDPTTLGVIIETSGAVLAAAIGAFATIRAAKPGKGAAGTAAPPVMIVISGALDSAELPIELAERPELLASAIDAARRRTGAVQEVALERPL